MRSSALTSSDFKSLYSGSNYNSPSNRFANTFSKEFGRNFNSPKNDSERSLGFATKLRSDSSSRYSPKAEKVIDSPSELRSSKVRDYSTPKSQHGFTSSASGFFSSYERNQAEKRASIEPNRTGKTYTQTPSYRPPSASSMSKSTMFREATREDSNILTRKKYDIDVSPATPVKVANENRNYSSKHSNLKDRYEELSRNDDTANYYPLDEFLSKYSISKTPGTTSTQSIRYNNSNNERTTDPSPYSLTMSKFLQDNQARQQPNNNLRSSSYLTDSGKNTKTSTPRYNSYFDRHGTNNETPKSQGLNYGSQSQFEYKKYDYNRDRDNSEYNSANEKPVLTRNEFNLRRNYAKERENSESDSEYNKQSHRSSQDQREKQRSYAAQPEQNGEKPSLDSFVTKVDRGGPIHAFRRFEERSEVKDDSPKTNARNNRESPFRQSQSTLTKEERPFRAGGKAYQDEEDVSPYSGDLKKWNSKYTRSSSNRNDESTDSGVEDSPPRTLSTYYVSNLKKYLTKPDEKDYFSQIYREHFQQTFQSMKLCKYMAIPDARAIAKKKVYLSKKDIYKNKKTIVFDLDETLIHCNDSANKRSDVKLPIRFPGGEVIEAGINVRPYAVECLKELSQHFELIVFTASHKCYANVVLDYLDPHKKYIQHRLYRDSCVYSDEGVYVKDLRVFADRDLRDLVLIDNAAYSFGFQMDNGIPIIPFYENKTDIELKLLIPYLKRLANVKDVREVNKQTFKFHQYSQYNSMNEVLDNVIC